MTIKELAEKLIHLLIEKSLTIATAESCTGGLVAKILTDVPGASKTFIGAIVSYSNQMKIKWLGVESTSLEKFGAVSRETAEQMVKGLLRTSGADVGISVSGIAGPTGGTPEKPVGTVYISTKVNNSLMTKKYYMKGNRESVRMQSAEKALSLAYELVNSSG